MKAEARSGEAKRVLSLVKDGTVYQAVRSESGAYAVLDTHQNHLPMALEVKGTALVARVACGENCFIFDGGMFRRALRSLSRACQEHDADLLLDLSRISLVAGGLPLALRFLESDLKRRGHRLVVVSPARVVQSHLLRDVPLPPDHIFGSRRDALAALGFGEAAAADHAET